MLPVCSARRAPEAACIPVTAVTIKSDSAHIANNHDFVDTFTLIVVISSWELVECPSLYYRRVSSATTRAARPLELAACVKEGERT